MLTLPDISPAKVGLFGISRDLHFGVCNHGEPLASLHTAREGERFYKEEKGFGRAIVHKESIHGFTWLSPC